MCLTGNGNIGNDYNLPPSGWSITSPPTIAYNCIAWAAGENERQWQPFGDYYWPSGIPREHTLDAYISLYLSLEFIEDPARILSYEEGIERIAIYVDDRNRPSHVARQITREVIARYPLSPNFGGEIGMWTSKITDEEDICHDNVHNIEGTLGHVVVVMTRPSNL
jgi:hypothetical protein